MILVMQRNKEQLPRLKQQRVYKHSTVHNLGAVERAWLLFNALA